MSNIVLAAGGDDGYQISRSLRFRNSATASLTRTAVSGNRKTYTLSFWMKRGALVDRDIISSKLTGTGGGYPAMAIAFDGDRLRVWDYTGSVFNINLYTTAVYRDPSAWYHVVLAVDTTQATSTDRVRLYVNGSQVTSFSTATYPAQNTDMSWNLAGNVNTIGGQSVGGYGYFDGYLTEIHGVDSQFLAASSFGETDSITGVWKPKKYAGTYGTNGFYLNFSDNSSNTAATIGKDYSGNGNNWTPNNISVTAGTTYDSMLDTPTSYADGGNGRGNYAVLNPLTKNTASTVSDGNLAWNCSPGSSGIRSSMALPSSGLIYLEATAGTSSSSGLGMAFGLFTQSVAVGSSYITGVANSWGIYSDASGVIGRNGTNTTGITIITANETYQLAVDLANSRAWLGRNNSWYDSGSGTTGNPSIGANPTFTSLPTDLLVGLWGDNTKTWVVNFGQRPFTYTPPTGFKALNTQNLPDATIKKGSTAFNAVTYTGNGATGQSITGAGFAPDLVWVKSRSGATDHGLQDTVRGATKDLNSNNTDAEETRASSITAFGSDGFTLGGNDAVYNASAATYAAWQWKKGAAQGFDIVTYTGTGANRTVAHSLGVAPNLIIVKRRDSAAAAHWPVYHSSITAANRLLLSTTDASTASAVTWNNTAPTSSVFSVGTSTYTNANAGTYVAYLFAEVAGFSKFGSYTGNGSADGPFVYCGFRPRFIMIKRTDTVGYDWWILDSARDTYNVVQNFLLPNSSVSEAGAGSPGASYDFLSNGFKPRTTSASLNASGATIIFAAFAENPFKNSLAR